MRLASVLTPMSNENLQLATQCGVTDIVARYPAGGLAELQEIQKRVASHGMQVTVVEGYLPIENIKIGGDDGTELRAVIQLLRDMGRLELPLLCYNFMAGTDWVRTRLDALRERGGQRPGASAFNSCKKLLAGYVVEQDSQRGPIAADFGFGAVVEPRTISE